MSEYLTEEEQLTRLKDWWKTYGTPILTGLLIALVMVVAYRAYQYRETQTNQRAFALYQQLIEKTYATPINFDEAISIQQALESSYSSTPYAVMANMLLASKLTETNKLEQALPALEWALSHSDSDVLTTVIRINLARLYLSLKQPEKALALMDTAEVAKSFDAVIAELKGDIYIAQGEREKAKQAYTTALKHTPVTPGAISVVQMKLNDLAS